MSNSIPAFSNTEFSRRLSAVRARMAANNVDLLFVEDPSNMAWLTGYDGWSFYVHQGVIVRHDAPPIWWGRMQDVNGARRTVHMADEHIVGYPEHYVQATDCHPMEHLADLITSKGFSNKAIGLELENYYFSAKAYITLEARLPNAQLIDASALVNWCRAVKSSEELVFMRKAARFSERMIDRALDRIEPGLAKNELVAEIYEAGLVDRNGDWGDYPAIVPLLPSGVDASAPHLTWNGETFRSGEATFFELSGCYRRYHAPLCRTVFLGNPPAEMLDAEKALQDGLAAGIEAARAGNRAADIARALYKALRAAGISRGGRCGYPVGLSYPPDWGERTISLRQADETVLEPGMTFHFMPGLWMDEWGLEITESILIREEGPAECLCHRPRQLFVKY